MAWIVFDIDGTLKPYLSSIPKSTISAIEKLKQAGHDIAIATGREYQETKETANLLGIDYLICCGGSQMIFKNEMIYDKYLDTDYMNRVISYFETTKTPYIIFNDNQCCSSYFPKRYFAFFKLLLPLFKLNIIKFGSTAGVFFQKVMSTKLTSKDEVINFKTKKIAFFKKAKNISIFEPFHIYNRKILHMVEFECKEEGIKLLKQNKNQKVVVFGDGFNDLSMFKYADLSIAMGNATSILKQNADYITKDSHKNGIMAACEYYDFFK